MNELRLILLGIGILIVAGIYFWGAYSNRQEVRSRIEKSRTKGFVDNPRIEITPAEEFDEGLDSVQDDKQTIDDLSLQEDKLPQIDDVIKTGPSPGDTARDSGKKKAKDQELIVLYIMAEKNRQFTGIEILKATKAVGMKFGTMNIFHHHGASDNQSKKPLFSLLNIVEPGNFKLSQMGAFSTQGLAIFMHLPVDNNGELIFDMMLDTAWELARILDGELHDTKHNLLDPAMVNTMREKASLA